MSDERHDERYYEGWSHDELRAALADLTAERDRLRADLDVSTADIDRYVAALQEILTFVSREPGTLAGRLWMIADQALDVSPAMGDAENEPSWRVIYYSAEGERVIYLRIGTTALALPALEAHKLGSALHAASGLDETSDTGEPPPLREVCPDCDGTGCTTCSGKGWRINPDYFGTVRDCP